MALRQCRSSATFSGNIGNVLQSLSPSQGHVTPIPCNSPPSFATTGPPKNDDTRSQPTVILQRIRISGYLHVVHRSSILRPDSFPLVTLALVRYSANGGRSYGPVHMNRSLEQGYAFLIERNHYDSCEIVWQKCFEFPPTYAIVQVEGDPPVIPEFDLVTIAGHRTPVEIDLSIDDAVNFNSYESNGESSSINDVCYRLVGFTTSDTYTVSLFYNSHYWFLQ